MTRAAKILCAIACAILLVTAVFHGTGYAQVSHVVGESNAPVFFKNTLPGLWLHFSIHLVILVAFGILALLSAVRARSLLAILALAVAADAALVFSFAGFFAGVALLAAAAVCFALAALQPPLPNGSRPDGAGREL